MAGSPACRRAACSGYGRSWASNRTESTRSSHDALLALVKAEHIAREELAESPRVAELIDAIESLNKRTRLPGLRELRRRLYG